ncbi:MAG TPA: RNA polymerase sigma factor [Ilumatobacteraceae bacterium]|nr:RNA polymerase sigma factor [Ilumatobacteraceae bacterium]
MTDTDRTEHAPEAATAFSDFYEAEMPGQVRRAAMMIGSTDLAHDLVHDAFVEIYRRWDSLDRPGPYLNRSVLNRCRDAGRSRTRRARLSERLRPEPAAWDQEPIADLLDGLSFNQRAVIVLRFYVGLSNVEIAEALDCPPGSVGPWITRALERLRKEMP